MVLGATVRTERTALNRRVYDYTAVQNKVNELCGTPKKIH